jgi:hypothetical protein
LSNNYSLKKNKSRQNLFVQTERNFIARNTVPLSLMLYIEAVYHKKE